MFFQGSCENKVTRHAQDMHRHTEKQDFFLSDFPGNLHRCMSQCSTKLAHMHRARADGVLHHREYLHEGAIFPHCQSFSAFLPFLQPSATPDAGCSVSL